MGEKIVVGPIAHGLKSNVTAFNVDNDAFPVLKNAYQWRGRIKRKRGTSSLTRLQRYFNSALSSYSSISSISLNNDEANILTGFSLQASGNIVPGSVTIFDNTASVQYDDTNADGILIGMPSGSGTINYATGDVTISGGGIDLISVIFNYYPGLPVMGLEELNLDPSEFPGNIAFDTTYSYTILNNSPFQNYDVSFYKNPVATADYPAYVPKTDVTSLKWNGENYQQFWTTNYQKAFWATNGISYPFDPTRISMQFKPIVTTTIVASGPPAQVTLQITGHGLVVGDFVYVNEVVGTTGINFQTGYVITVTDVDNVIVEFPNATIATNGTGGIAQYLTNSAFPTKDCIRWYDGDPTNGSPTNPILNGSFGWVNFCPPLSQSNFSISDLPAAIYYLVGGKIILPFKDRLLIFGPVVQTSTGDPIYLQDTVVYSQNGTPYYTCSYTNTPSASADTPTSATNEFFPILLPENQTATPFSFFEDSTGFGGFISAGFSQPIVTVNDNEDVLIVGFSNKQTRFVYTGNDIVPFNFFVINSEYGSSGTFSSVNFDRGVVTIGTNGIVMTNQTGSQRIDLEIPDEIFQFQLTNNGLPRICTERDFISEWMYFTYSGNQNEGIYPNRTLIWNYRDNSWGMFFESYTTYGTFRQATGEVWQDLTYFTWENWNSTWESYAATLLQPQPMAGNQQGFVLLRDNQTTNEGISLSIQGFSTISSLVTEVTCLNHQLNPNDFVIFSNCIGTISPINGKIFKITSVTGTNTFRIAFDSTGLTYVGNGNITRTYVPQIQTRAFPVSWAFSRKTRIGPQMYLFTTTDNAQITLQIYLSMNTSSPYNEPPIVPDINTSNNSLIYSNILYTCPESTNLGLTPSNTNLQMLTAAQQDQIWHRMNTSLLGDTVQIGFTLSEEQMLDPDFNNCFAEIELHSFILDVNPSQILA